MASAAAAATAAAAKSCGWRKAAVCGDTVGDNVIVLTATAVYLVPSRGTQSVLAGGFKAVLRAGTVSSVKRYSKFTDIAVVCRRQHTDIAVVCQYELYSHSLL